MLYAQIQSTLTVSIDACLLLVPMLFVAHVVCKFGPKKAEDQGSIAEVEVAEVEVAEPEVEVAEVEVAEPEVKEVEPEVEVAEVEEVEPEVEVAEVKEVEPEVEELDPEQLFLALEKDQAMKCETLMDMLDRVSEEIESSIHAWELGTDMITTPLEVKEARLRFKAGEDLVVSTECDRTRECFKVQKIGNKYVYALNFEGTTCKFSIESVKFWSA